MFPRGVSIGGKEEWNQFRVPLHRSVFFVFRVFGATCSFPLILEKSDSRRGTAEEQNSRNTSAGGGTGTERRG